METAMVLDVTEKRDAMKRIHELAKEQGVESTSIIEVLKRAGLPESKCTPSSTISPEWEQRLMPLFDRLRDAAQRQLERETAVQRTRQKRATTRKKAAARTTAGATPGAKRRTTKTTSKAKKPQPQKRYTAKSLPEAVPSDHTPDAWDEVEAYERSKQADRRAEVSTPRRRQRQEPVADIVTTAPTAEEIVAAAGLPLIQYPPPSPTTPKTATPTAKAKPAEAASEHPAATAPAQPRVADGTPATPEATAAATAAAEPKKVKKGRGGGSKKQRKEIEISSTAAELARKLAQRQGSAGKPAKPAKPAKRRAAAAEESLTGPSLLGEIAQHDDDEITAAVGSVPEDPRRPRPASTTGRKKKDTPAVAAGFQQGRGFSVGPRTVGNNVFDQRGRSGGRGKKFFRVTAGGGGRGRKGGRAQPVRSERPEQITVSPPITIKDLSQATGIRVADIIRTLLSKGQMLRQNDIISEDLALEIGLEFNVEIEFVKKRHDGEDLLAQLADKGSNRPEDMQTRAPVITILGHVDHGKTSLLDRVRKSQVAEGEAGGITQHIGAYKVRLDEERSVVFVDTPGHEAFTEMRARGANVTDVVVLVVAADDGVMPQTTEAYNHAKAANVPVVVALNKIDKANANVLRVKQQLASMGLQPVEWGGDAEVIEVSALTGQGVDGLLETLWLQSEILDLKANPSKRAEGTCLEARKTEGRGIVANLLVQDGTLRPGDVIVSGCGYGRIRAAFDDRGNQLTTVGPSTPIEVIGLEELPEAGVHFYVLQELSQAREIAEARAQRLRQEELAEKVAANRPTQLEDLFSQLEAGETQEVRLVLKTDVRGSLEVLQKELIGLSTDEVSVRVLHGAVGGITESDVLLADASNGIIIGFNVVPDDRAKEASDRKGVDIRTYRVIYQVKDDVKAAMEGLLAPDEQEEITGEVDVRRIFKASQIGNIAGCYITKGKVTRGSKVRVIRDGVIKYEGQISTLRRHKDDAKDVREGFECGITLKDFQDIHPGDRLQAFEIRMVARTLA